MLYAFAGINFSKSKDLKMLQVKFLAHRDLKAESESKFRTLPNILTLSKPSFVRATYFLLVFGYN